MKLLLAVLLINFLLSACVVGPDYKTPQLEHKANWSSNNKQSVTNEKPIDLSWWQSFADPQLNAYVQQAASCNLDLRIAKARIREARALKQVAEAKFYPLVDGTSTAQSLNLSKQGATLGFFSNFPGINYIQRNQNLYTLGFDALWEIDLFGKTKRSVESQQASVEQRNEERRNVLLSTIADVVRNYSELRGAQRQLKIAQQNLKLQQQALLIAKKRFSVGTGNAIELSTAQSQLDSIAAVLPNYSTQIRVNAYQLAVLLGREPQLMLDELERSHPSPIRFKPIPLGLRSDVLRQRPDVRAAERQLAASVADIGVAVADLFPQFTLVGDMALQSVAFDTLLNASNVAWTLGPSLRFPIFQAGRIKANIARRKALTQQAALQYRQVILNALNDAETSLVRYSKERERNQQLARVVAANQQAADLAKQRYDSGEDDLTALIRTQLALNQKRSDLLSSQIAAQIDSISLYKALGGGWECFEDSSQTHPPPRALIN